jgi:hypothetical protein
MAQKQQQPTPEQLAQIQKMKNEQFMAMTYDQPILATAPNGTDFALGKNLQFEAPIVASAIATKITIRADLTVNWDGVGTVKNTASYPYSLLGNQISVTYGSKVATFHPYLAKINAMTEGYSRTEFDNSKNFKSATIDAMLRTIPTTLVSGQNKVKFDVDYELNALHPVSVNGLLPISSTGVRLQTHIPLPSSVAQAKADSLDHSFEVAGGGVITVSGTVSVVYAFRDNTSMTTRQNMELDLNGLPTVQVIQLPTAQLLSQGAYNHVSIRNPYPFAKIIHIACDGLQSDVFSKADNIIGYSLDKAENSNSAFLRYDETNGGIVNMYKRNREKFGTDLPEGVIVHDFTTDNLANVSSKTGGAYLNLTGEGYPAARFGVKFASINNTDRVSKIVSYGVILNGEGVQTR